MGSMGSGYFPSPTELVQLLWVAVPFSYAALLLLLSLLTLTTDAHDTLSTRLFRCILVPPVIYYFWEACSSYRLFSTCFTVSGVATLACYGSVLVLRFAILQFWHPTRPRWLKLQKKDGQAMIMAYYDPQNLSERFFYVFDLLCSMRGTSWFSDRVWDWKPSKSERWTKVPARPDFIIDSFQKAIKLFILLDIFDTIVKCRAWDSQAREPLYVIPIWQQCAFATALCIGISITLNIHYTYFSALAVGLGNDPINWPPLFNSPFQASSISDFWSNRWHQLFRQMFSHCSIPAIRLAQRLFRCKSGLPVTLTRIFCVFAISTVLHLFIMYHGERWFIFKHGDGNIDRVSFWDVDIALFFMAQPFGMIFEKYVLEAVVDRVFPSPFNHASQRSLYVNASTKPFEKQIHSRIEPPLRWEKVLIMRAFTWSFFIWTGRWWTNKWIRSGFFDHDVKAVPLSLIRSLWHRKFIL